MEIKKIKAGHYRVVGDDISIFSIERESNGSFKSSILCWGYNFRGVLTEGCGSKKQCIKMIEEKLASKPNRRQK